MIPGFGMQATNVSGGRSDFKLHVIKSERKGARYIKPIQNYSRDDNMTNLA
jgi:hypothetical protein